MKDKNNIKLRVGDEVSFVAFPCEHLPLKEMFGVISKIHFRGYKKNEVATVVKDGDTADQWYARFGEHIERL